MAKRNQIVLGVVGGTVVFCGLFGYGLVESTFGRSARQLNRELEATRRAGIPLEPSQLESMVRVADEQNAAPLYRQAVRLVQDREVEKALKAVSDSSSPRATAAQRAAGLAALRKVEPALKLVEAGAARPGCDFRREWTKGMYVLFPEFGPMKGFVKALGVRAREESRAGDWRKALRTLESAQRVAQHAGQEPILIGLLVQIACETIVQRDFQAVIDDHGRDQGFLAAAQSLHRKFGPLPDFRRALYGELVVGRVALKSIRGRGDLEVFSELDPGSMPAPPSRLERMVFEAPVVRNGFESKLLKNYRELILDLPKDPEDWPGTERAAKASETRVAADQSLANVMSSILMPVFSQASRAIGRTQTNRRLTETSLRLLSERAEGKPLPAHLRPWGDVIIDPYSGNPFVYRRKGKGFLLYGVGEDGVDDGGVTRKGSGGSTGYDMVVEFR
jgi:hypothetical protein